MCQHRARGVFTPEGGKDGVNLNVVIRIEITIIVQLFHRSLFIRENGLRGRARCVVPGVSAAVAIATWLGRALAVGARKLLGGLDV